AAPGRVIPSSSDGLAMAPAFGLGETGLIGVDRSTGGQTAQGHGGGGMGEFQGRVDLPAFMERIEDAGGKGVAGAIGADDLGLGNADRRGGADPAVSRDGDGAGREMHDD